MRIQDTFKICLAPVLVVVFGLPPAQGHASEFSSQTVAPAQPAQRFTHLRLADGLSHTDHGGRVWAESQVGQGATFYFSLPPAA